MIDRRRFLALGGLGALGVAAGCAPARSGNEVIVWTTQSSSDALAAQEQIIAKYEAAHPGERIRLVAAPKQGANDADGTALITAVRGRTGPDVYVADRFNIPQFASIGLLDNVQDLVDREGAGFADQYLKFALDETTFAGDVYGLPWDTDARGLYYNKKLLRDAGIDPAVLDPANGAPTIDEVFAIADKISKTDATGNYSQLGFVPWFEQGWPFTYALMEKATLFDAGGCRISTDDAGFRRVYEDYAAWGDKLGYEKTDTFKATYQPPNAPPSQSPFFNGKLGMVIVYSNLIFNIKKYAPDLDWGVTYPPVRAEGDTPYSWSGGSAFTIPKGAENREGAWKFMTWMSGEVGQKDWAVSQNYLPTYAKLLDDEEVVGQQAFFAGLLRDGYSTNRPPLPVGSQLWESMNTARDAVLLGDSTPAQAMDTIMNQVQPQLEPFCPVVLGRA